MYVCVCRAIREETVQQLGRCGVVASEEIATALELRHPECCGRCLRSIERFVEIACDAILPQKAPARELSTASSD